MFPRKFNVSKKCESKKSPTKSNYSQVSQCKSNVESVSMRRGRSNDERANQLKKRATVNLGYERSSSIIFSDFQLPTDENGDATKIRLRDSSNFRRSEVRSVDQYFTSNFLKLEVENGANGKAPCKLVLVRSKSVEDLLPEQLNQFSKRPIAEAAPRNTFHFNAKQTLPMVKGGSAKSEEKERKLKEKRETLMSTMKGRSARQLDFPPGSAQSRKTHIDVTTTKSNLDKDDVFLGETNDGSSSNNLSISVENISEVGSKLPEGIPDKYEGANRGNLFLGGLSRYSASTGSTSSTPDSPRTPNISPSYTTGYGQRTHSAKEQSVSARKLLFRRSLSECGSIGGSKAPSQERSPSFKKQLFKNKAGSRASDESLFKGILRKSRKKKQRSHSDGGDRGSSPWLHGEGGGNSATTSPQNEIKSQKFSFWRKGSSMQDKIQNENESFPAKFTSNPLNLEVTNQIQLKREISTTSSIISSTRNDELRKENSLKVRIQEAKGIPDKKRYYCVLIVNGKETHQTSTKLKAGLCFWGEEFEVFEYQEVKKVVLRLMREDKKVVGFGEFEPISSIQIPKLDEWVKVVLEKPGKEKEDAAIRIRYTFRSLMILPLSEYKGFIKYLNQSSLSLCKILEAHLNAKAKEDFLTSLVTVLHYNTKATSFMGQLIKKDVEQNGHDDKVMFRANSMATKAIEAYMRLVGKHYLEVTLMDSISYLINTNKEFEVDQSKFESESPNLEERQMNLMSAVRGVWESILSSTQYFPEEIRSVFFVVRENMKNSEMADRLISASVFLRLLCPATMSPTLFDLTKEYPQPASNRRLTLVAKTIQTLANFTTFQSKEDYMQFLNPFIEEQQTNCRQFLSDISGPSPRSSVANLQDSLSDIYVGRHLALLHLHFKDVLSSASSVNDSDMRLLNTQITTLSDRLLEQEKLVLLRQKENQMKVTSPVPYEFLKSTPKLATSISVLSET